MSKKIIIRSFEDDGEGNCLHCREKSHNCDCANNSARALGFGFVFKPKKGWKKGDNFFESSRDLVRHYLKEK